MSKSIYEESASLLITKHGYLEARRKCIQWRDMNSPGTFSFADHNAVLKALVKMAAEQNAESN